MINMQIYYSLSCIVQFLFIASLCCSFDVNPYRFKRIIEAEPCRLEKLLLVVVHSSVEVCVYFGIPYGQQCSGIAITLRWIIFSSLFTGDEGCCFDHHG